MGGNNFEPLPSDPSCTGHSIHPGTLFRVANDRTNAGFWMSKASSKGLWEQQVALPCVAHLHQCIDDGIGSFTAGSHVILKESCCCTAVFPTIPTIPIWLSLPPAVPLNKPL